MTTGFIDQALISDILADSGSPGKNQIREILDKGKEMKGLDISDIAALLNISDTEMTEELFSTAEYVKEYIYGKRLVLFAPLYISNLCRNECLYCGFRRSNADMTRTSLSMEEIGHETEFLINEGHKRILLVSGEGPDRGSLDYVLNAIEKIYSVENENGNIRRINVNIAPVTVEGFRRLKNAGIGTYQLFQETYHYETFRQMHRSGPKSDYLNHLTAMDRAMAGGVDDVGIGVLFGLYDHRFEVIALMQHIAHLEKEFGVGCHTISIPRIEPAAQSPVSLNPPFKVSDQELKKIISILRIAVPYTGLILSTRETEAFRNSAFRLGISQISAGSRTSPGGYAGNIGTEQFSLCDTRSLEEVISDLVEFGHIPSFCTGCYRLNRTGSDFMDQAKPGLIKHYCLQNGLTSFQEYLVRFAGPALRRRGEKLIDSMAGGITRGKTLFESNLKRTRNGEKDLYI